MRKVNSIIAIFFISVVFLNCKNSTEPATDENTITEDAVTLIVDNSENVNNEVITVDSDSGNPVSVKNEVKSNQITNTPKPKEVKSNSNPSVPIKEVVSNPKQDVVVNTPAPKPSPDPSPTPTPTPTPTPATTPTPVPVVQVPVATSNSSNWEVPSKYNTMKNPTDKSDSDGLAEGKVLYVKHCKSCHGATGKGDGTKAGDIDTPMPNFFKPIFQAQTDGDLFYKTKTGREDMPGFSKKMDDEEIWFLVNYMRTLK